MAHFLWVFFFVYGNKSSSAFKASGGYHNVEQNPLAFSKTPYEGTIF